MTSKDPQRIEVPCGDCYYCRKRYANDWRIRLLNELKYSSSRHNWFVTLSISPEFMKEFADNPKQLIRYFLERYRKKYKKSCRHWFVTELGDKTQRLHFHGVLFDCLIPFDSPKPWLPKQNYDYTMQNLAKMWKYGHVYVGYCSEATTNYIVKYCTEVQIVDDKPYRPKVFASPGIGKAYVDDPLNIAYHKSLPENEFLLKIGGFNYALPRYYKLKLYSETYLRLLSFKYPQWSQTEWYLNGKTYYSKLLYYEALSRKKRFYTTNYDRLRFSRKQAKDSNDAQSLTTYRRSIDSDKSFGGF